MTRILRPTTEITTVIPTSRPRTNSPMAKTSKETLKMKKPTLATEITTVIPISRPRMNSPMAKTSKETSKMKKPTLTMKIMAVILISRMNSPTMKTSKMSKTKTPTMNQRTNSQLMKDMTRNSNASMDSNRGCMATITTSDMTRLMSRVKRTNRERSPHRQLEGESPPQLARTRVRGRSLIRQPITVGLTLHTNLE